MQSPFPPSATTPGSGTVNIKLLPPSHPIFSTLIFTYPLKLIPSNHHVLSQTDSTPSESGILNNKKPTSVPLLFLLTYGGGLLSHDHIILNLEIDDSARLTLATQGSTKIFKPEDPTSDTPPLATQALHCTLRPHSAVFYAPHPTQPFAQSHYAQTQIFSLHINASLGLLDWVSEGRRARNESWLSGVGRARMRFGSSQRLLALNLPASEKRDGSCCLETT